MNIALNMVVYNEAHRIYETLEEVHRWVQEFIIVDQSSTDSTQEEIFRFAENYDAMVSLHTDKHWGYCEKSRKMAWENTSTDFVLVLDADERVTEKFGNEMQLIADGKILQNDFPVLGCNMQRSFYLGKQHRFTGDMQYRFFKHDAVNFLEEIHTSPQPTIPADRIYSTPYVAIEHLKTWKEQIRDELAYEQYLLEHPYENNRQAKLDLNVHLPLWRASGLTPEEIDNLSLEQWKEMGLS